MSVTPPPANEGTELTAKELKAQAKANKAQAKALRPWYKKPLPIIGLVVIAGMAISATGGGSDSGSPAASQSTAPNTSQSAPQEAPTSEGTPGIGDKVRDGNFEFVVTKFKCGITSVGQDYTKVTPQGEFCKASVTVTNIGNEAQTMDSTSQILYDNKERQFSSSSDTWMADEDGSAFFLSGVNPGNSIKGAIYFDVSPGTVPSVLELHDSMFSGGIKVSVK